ncbi:MAG: potassium transporter TrkG [Dehalococcoidia bacterium]
MQSGGVPRQGSRVGNVRVQRGRRRSQVIDVKRVRIQRPRRPGVLLLILGFLVMIVVGTALLSLPFASAEGTRVPFMTALFTATSAVCVTGLVVADTRETWSPFGQAVIITLIQAGGLGFMTSATLLLMVLGRRLSLRQRMTAGAAAGQIGTMQIGALIRRVVMMTFAVEGVGAAVLVGAFTLHDSAFGLEQLWRGVFTAISAFNNAGFDLEGGGTSLQGYVGNPLVLGSIGVMAFIGATGYAVWWDIWRQRRWRSLQLNTKIVLATSLSLTALSTVVILLSEAVTPGLLHDAPLGEAVEIAALESVYARTSGFTAIDLSLAHDETLLVIIALMFIGGASASTAGGIKINTFTVLFFTIVSSARGDEHVHAFGREIPWRQVNRALSVALLAVALLFVTTFFLAVTTELPLLPVMFEAVSAFATCGLSLGVTGTLDSMSQGIVILAMFVGRLGPLTFALALAERFERRDRFRYPEAEINIG